MDSDVDEWSFTGFFYDFNNDGVEDEVDQSQCPFYGGWGEDVVADRLNHRHHKKHGHDALPELLFHCRDGDDCEEICDCLGGHLRRADAQNLYPMAGGASDMVLVNGVLMPRA